MLWIMVRIVYTHWRGSMWPSVPRWGDRSLVALFSEEVGGWRALFGVGAHSDPLSYKEKNTS